MKKLCKLLLLSTVTFFSLGMPVASVFALDTTRSTVTDTTAHLELVDHNYKDEGITSKMGYHWKCSTCGYVSEWHLLASTAVKNAEAHMVKYPGHITSVYGV